MSRFRFSRWLAGLSTLFAVVLIAAGGASAQTTGWDFAALLHNLGPCQLLTNPQTVSQTGFGSIKVSSPDATPTVKGGDLGVGDTERGLGLSLSPGPACDGDEVGDGGFRTLVLDLSTVKVGSNLTAIDLGSLQANECYKVSISNNGGTPTVFEACDGDGNANKTLNFSPIPTAGLKVTFEKSHLGDTAATDNDYVVKTVTTNTPVGICHNIGGPRELGANCDATGCTVDRPGEDPLVVEPGQFLGIIIGFNQLNPAALAAHIKHGDGTILQTFDPPLHLASTGQTHKASNVECLAERIIPQPPDHGN